MSLPIRGVAVVTGAAWIFVLARTLLSLPPLGAATLVGLWGACLAFVAVARALERTHAARETPPQRTLVVGAARPTAGGGVVVPIRSGVWMDVVFVNVSGDALPLEGAMAPFAKLSAPYAMERFRLAHSQAGDVPANWKLTIEAAVENYHEEFVHPSLPARVDAEIGGHSGEFVAVEQDEGAVDGV